MTISLCERQVRGVVLDIEGTTTPVSFVYDELFPYARANLREFLTEHGEQPEVETAVTMLRAERGDQSSGSLIAFIESLIDSDTKSPGLKLLQGVIWQRGYENGTLRGNVYPDVLPALQRWRHANIELSIYSSGSVLAQRLLFGSTLSGDLTPFIRHYFDMSIGGKRSSASYTRIAQRIGYRPEALLFVSDVVAELDPARAAGFQTVLCIRPGNAPQPDTDIELIRSLDEIVV